MEQYDLAIVGSGIGGLVCANLLAREGRRVCVLEKNKQIGGCLQIYARDRVVFDAGVHYLGGLAPGQNLHQIFKYLGILDTLRLERMDEDGFDQIILEGDPRPYPLAQGGPRFIDRLSQFFPEERPALERYIQKIQEVCQQFPLYQLRRGGSLLEKTEAMSFSAKEFIGSLSANPDLVAVLAGNNILYAGQGSQTPFHIHALVSNSYLESAWRLLDGGSAIAHALAHNIRQLGGVVKTRAEVRSFEVDEAGQKVTHLELSDGSVCRADAFISNLTPVKTYQLMPTSLVRPGYRQRMESLPNTVAAFLVNLVLEPARLPYVRHNTYFQGRGHGWDMADYRDQDWPRGFAIYPHRSSHQQDFAEGLTLMTYMRFEEMEPWIHTRNTTLHPMDRGPEYRAFKEARARKLMDAAGKVIPGLEGMVRSFSCATPLTFRDYIGNDDGTLYGFSKNWQAPYQTLVPPQTKLKNLFLTGQNLHLHGVLGCALSALLTSASYLGDDAFIDRIRNA